MTIRVLFQLTFSKAAESFCEFRVQCCCIWCGTACAGSPCGFDRHCAPITAVNSHLFICHISTTASLELPNQAPKTPTKGQLRAAVKDASCTNTFFVITW